jgi:hypothetical protein
VPDSTHQVWDCQARGMVSFSVWFRYRASPLLRNGNVLKIHVCHRKR